MNTATILSIEQLERAINIWRVRRPAPTGADECPTLCTEARALADIYALMIMERSDVIAIERLNPAQRAALRGALSGWIA
ncbi:DUF3717 domain-containing protein [Burkholderia cenocepacia]|uniref:DUF3717 domain-containing protein n=1 Tax=Burkholderia cenocepacia TaxID=95486 RepID=UPI00196B98FC|nr:DUF3717 domain-containing protein [Burkholderia cenocepacia]MBN3506344.1 DUF3717 domain-containing protein [Burkholderia cenocepacia]MBR8029864.1 DUF3717 domain-containing protein [Burkholderia cenocepacia]MBR8172184.1 DUF3717 domain-containing protein [Burkholderia cenocepacia]